MSDDMIEARAAGTVEAALAKLVDAVRQQERSGRGPLVLVEQHRASPPGNSDSRLSIITFKGPLATLTFFRSKS